MSKKSNTVLFVLGFSVVMLGFIFGVALLLNFLVVLVTGGKITQQIEKFVFPMSFVAAIMLNFWLSAKVIKLIDKKFGLDKHFSSLGFGKKNNRE